MGRGLGVGTCIVNYYRLSELQFSMAVDIVRHQLSPTQAYAKMAFGQKSKSTEELSDKTAVPTLTSLEVGISNRTSTASEESSAGSMLDMSLLERSEIAVEQLRTSRNQLENEIEVT